MTALENLTAGASVRGLLASGAATVESVQWIGRLITAGPVAHGPIGWVSAFALISSALPPSADSQGDGADSPKVTPSRHTGDEVLRRGPD